MAPPARPTDPRATLREVLPEGADSHLPQPNSSTMKYRILIADDEVDILEFIRYNLQREGYEVYTAENGAEALRLAREHHPHLILLDRMMPVMDGAQTCRAIRQEPELKQTMVVFLSALGEEEEQLKGFDAGADDYMVKPFDFRELNARIKALLKRNTNIATEQPEELKYADLTINLKRKEVWRNGVMIKLSPKEYNLLLYLTENAERVISRTEIAEKVWNTHFDTGTNFIDVYINYLRKKVDKEFEIKLIHTRPGIGFIFTDKP